MMPRGVSAASGMVCGAAAAKRLHRYQEGAHVQRRAWIRDGAATKKHEVTDRRHGPEATVRHGSPTGVCTAWPQSVDTVYDVCAATEQLLRCCRRGD